jgi:hypothetical protein
MVEDPKYDVAISFLQQDVNTAHALATKLKEVFDVFFYPDRQEELAGTDGMEFMRTPFFEDSRLMVVLYREKWGKTRWTAIEERAIKEACFNGEWSRLFFIVVEDAKVFPGWLTPTHIRFNLVDFGIDGAAAAIKARVLENRGRLKPMTPLKRAEVQKADDEYRKARQYALSPSGEAGVEAQVEELIREILKQCEAVNAAGNQQISFGAFKEDLRECVMTDGNVSMSIFWQNERTLSKLGYIAVSEYNDRLTLPTEARRQVYARQPQRVGERRYKPDLSRSLDIGWEEPDTKEFLSSKALAEKCVIAFMDLVEKRNSGRLTRSRG